MNNNDYVCDSSDALVTFSGTYGDKPYLWYISSLAMAELSDREWEEYLAVHKEYRIKLLDRLTVNDVVDLLYVAEKEREISEGAMLRLLSKHGITRDSIPWP